MPAKLTTESFIEKATKVHKGRYDYSNVEYKSSTGMVKIICPVHGEFEQRAGGHLSGKGCKKCYGKELKDTQTFIAECKAVHGNTYDYSLTDYKGKDTPVTVVCRQHGEFYPRPANHVKLSTGCPKCFSSEKITTEVFLKRAVAVHADTYDYSLVKSADGQQALVDIVCKTHGRFRQKVKSHLSGQGCKKCAGIHQYSQEEFIEKCKELHGNRYSYSKAEYKRANLPITITCREHGDFEQLPTVHMRPAGCRRCAGSEKLTTEEFIEKARTVHGDRYTYDKVVYDGNKKDVVITCGIHGDFQQAPATHYDGSGCPSCSKGGFKRNLPGLVYLLRDGVYLKVGITNSPVEQRVAVLNRARPSPFYTLKTWHFEDGAKASSVETMALSLFRLKYKQQEQKWDGFTETFISDDVNHFISTIESIIDSLK